MNRRGTLYLIIVALGTAQAPGFLWADSAALKPIKGSVYIQHPGKNLWEDVKAQVAVEDGDRIKTNNDSSAFLILPDDHRVAIAADTQLTLQRVAQGETKLFLKTGAVRSKVRHLNLDLGQYYKVQTPAAVCAVRGTDFSVTQPGTGGPQVHVFEGLVDLSALRKDVASEATRIEAGHSASMDNTGTVQPNTPAGPPAGAPVDQPPAKPKSDEGQPGSHNGPPPPGGGGSGPVWYDHPETINPSTFNPTTGPGPNPPAPGDPNAGGTSPRDPRTAGDPNFHPTTNTSFNPLSGTGFGRETDPNNPNYTGPNNIYNPPPSGNTTTGAMDPAAAGNQALFATIQSQNLNTQLQGLLVAGLYNDGSVKLSPIDGKWHLYSSAIQQNGADGIIFMNATMAYNQPNTLNYQTATVKFNAPLPVGPGAYATATKVAFRQDFGAALPTFYATDVHNRRSNTVDFVDVNLTNGQTFFDPTANRYVTKFPDGNVVVNGTELWHVTGGAATYLGGAASQITYSATGMADAAVNNIYHPTTGTDITFGRRITYFDDSGRIASMGTLPTTTSPWGYFASDALTAQDMLFSNLFHNGPIVFFGSAKSRLLGGVDSLVNNSDATDVLTGKMAPGMPDGLLRM